MFKYLLASYFLYKVSILSDDKMAKIKSKYVKLTYFKFKDNGEKRQARISLPVKMIDKLKWKAGDKLKVWINKKKHIEIRKKS